MQSKVTINYAANVDDSKKSRNKNENEKQTSCGSFDLHHSEAQTYQTIGEFKKAINSYSRALEIKPGDKKCLIARGMCFLKIGNAEDAFSDANEISENDPQYVKSLLIKADSLHQMTQFEYALMFYHRGRRMRPEMKEFGQGIQRAEEAIYNAIGDNSGIVFKIPNNLPDFCEELDIQKTLGLSILTSTKMRLLEKPEAVDNVGGGNKTSREERKGGDDNNHEKSSKKYDPLKKEFEADDATLEVKAKILSDNKSSKQLLGELHADKEFLESLLNETEAANNQSDANKQIRSLTIKELNFLGSRSEFWEQQKPLYSRNHEKVLKEQNYNKNINDAKSYDWIGEEIESIENSQHQGDFKLSLERSAKLLKMMEKQPNDGGSKMVKIYSLMGKASVELENFKDALKWHQHEFDVAVKNKLQGSESKAFESMGRIFMKIGDFKAALNLFQKLLKKKIDGFEKSKLMQDIARCYFELENFKKSEEFGQKSLQEAKLEYDEVNQMKAFVMIAQSQEKRNRYQEALDNYREALTLSSANYDKSMEEEIIKKAIDDLETKVQDGGVDSDTSESDDNDPHDGDDDGDDDDSRSVEITSITSMSSHSSSHVSSICGKMSQEGSKVRKCPQHKDTKASKHGARSSNVNKTSTVGKMHKKDESRLKKDDGDDDDDDGDNDGVKKKEQKKTQDDVIKKSISYNVTIKTGNIFSASTLANVFIVIFGKHGKTEIIPLKLSLNNPVPFEDGKTDKFIVSATDVGTIKQIQIFHNGSQMNDGWFLEEMRITSPTFQEVYFFYVHRWLCKFNDDGKTSRTLEPTNVSLKPQSDYRVTLVSGEDSNLMNSIQIYISIFGKHLKTDKMPLRLNPNNSETSFVDKIKVKGTDVKKIAKIKIGLEHIKPHSRWHLLELRIRHGSKKYSFPVDEWFEKDGTMEKELTPSVVSDEKSKSSHMTTHLKTSKHHWSSGDDDDDDDGRKKSHGLNKKFDKSKKEGRKTKEKNGGSKKKIKKTLYTVEIRTGDYDCTGADGNIFLVFIGEKGTSSKFTLTGSSKMEAFLRGSLDVFKLECLDVGQISKIKIGHDSDKKHLTWFVESVKVESKSRSYLFKVNKWFDKEKGDGKVVRWIKPSDVIVKRLTGKRDDDDDDNDNDHDDDVRDVIDGADDDDENRKGNKDGYQDGDDVVNDCDEEDNDDCDDDHEEASYQIEVKTGKCFGAGTDANVFIQIEGDKGRTERLHLDKTNSTKKEHLFERGQTNNFSLKTKDVGKIEGILIGHDGSKFGAGWFLEELKIKSVGADDDVYHFAVNQWFDKKEGDGKIERHFVPSKDDDDDDEEGKGINTERSTLNSTSKSTEKNNKSPINC